MAQVCVYMNASEFREVFKLTASSLVSCTRIVTNEIRLSAIVRLSTQPAQPIAILRHAEHATIVVLTYAGLLRSKWPHHPLRHNCYAIHSWHSTTALLRFGLSCHLKHCSYHSGSSSCFYRHSLFGSSWLVKLSASHPADPCPRLYCFAMRPDFCELCSLFY